MATNNTDPFEEPTGKVTFYEGPHTYENENGDRYLSTTQLLDKFKEKFNAREVAEKVTKMPKSKYFGRKVEDVIKEWEGKGHDARVRGTAFHKGKEDNHNQEASEHQELKKQEVFVPNPKMIIPVENTGVMTDYKDLPDGVYSELILWSHRWRLAGIADKVIIDGEFFDIEDYKTNKSIDKTSYYEKGKGNRMMKFPLNDIMDCSFNHYQLQLSIYAYMFAELSGKTPRNLTILHHPTIDGVVTQEETRYPCVYQKHHLMLMFNLWGGYAPKNYKARVVEN
jgi:ATP-dependent exoDNAse (exonuclease V) beta subunit